MDLIIRFLFYIGSVVRTSSSMNPRLLSHRQPFHYNHPSQIKTLSHFSTPYPSHPPSIPLRTPFLTRLPSKLHTSLHILILTLKKLLLPFPPSTHHLSPSSSNPSTHTSQKNFQTHISVIGAQRMPSSDESIKYLNEERFFFVGV